MYDHYIAIDWAQRKMAIARMSGNLEKVSVVEGPTDLQGVKDYLARFRGSKILTLEESTGAQWLYTELKSRVDKLIICNPHRNRLLSEGAKNDKIDATKLVKLLKANLLKEVYHSSDELIELRKRVSGYEDLVRMGVGLKNQRSALFRGKGQDHAKTQLDSARPAELFVLQKLEEQIENYEKQKTEYEAAFKTWGKTYRPIQLLKSIPGIGEIHAVQIAATVVDIGRFETSGKFLSYCGLIVHEKRSGGQSYGKRYAQYCRLLKRVFKMASFSVLQAKADNPMRAFYEYQLMEKRKAPHIARHALARRIAVLCYGVLRSGKKYEPKRRSMNSTEQMGA